MGVGAKGGAEAIIDLKKLSYEKILTSSSSSGILQIEFCDKFNLIKGSQMLKAVVNSMPGITAFNNFCYSQHIQLFYQKFALSSESGIQQGDSLGPSVFFFDTLAHYRENSGIVARASAAFLVSRRRCLLVDSENNLIRSWHLVHDRGLHVSVNKFEL